MACDLGAHALRPGAALTQAQAHQIKWSEAMNQVVALENQDVQFTSFSVSRNREVDIEGVSKNIAAVRQLLDSLEENPEVHAPFIANIGKNQQPGSAFQNNFSLSFTFIENTSLSEKNTPDEEY